MIGTWMFYSAVVALLLGLAALAAERICLIAGRPTRWVWLAAFSLSVLAPSIVPWMAGATVGADGAAMVGATSVGIPGIPADALAPAADSATSWLERTLGIGWLAGSTGLAALFLLSAATLERERRGWRFGTVGGRTVRVSARTGPAVAGFLWPEVVVPDRVLRWEAEAQRLMVEHEAEHERTGDPHLLLASLAGLILMPWNPALWWQARRLRFAIEVDCDARVLRNRPSIERYGRLLIEVARSCSSGVVPVAAFSRPRSLLERRLRILATPVRSPRGAAHLGLWALIIVPPLAAITLPAPDPPDFGSLSTERPEEGRPTGAEAGTSARQAADPSLALGSEPTFTAMEVRPELRNAPELAAALESRMASSAEREAAGDTAVFWALIDEGGLVRDTRMVTSSGVLAFDRAAREALRETARFTPAREGNGRVAGWIQVALGAGGPREAESLRIPIATTPLPDLPAHAADAGGRGGPATSAPRLRDPDAFERIVGRSYPAELRNAGIGGTVVLWVFVDAGGAARSTRLAATSGSEQLDLVAREVVLQARFTSGDGARGFEPAWIQVPVTFAPR